MFLAIVVVFSISETALMPFEIKALHYIGTEKFRRLGIGSGHPTMRIIIFWGFLRISECTHMTANVCSSRSHTTLGLSWRRDLVEDSALLFVSHASVDCQ